MKKLCVLFIAILAAQCNYSQNLDKVTETKLIVKLKKIENAYNATNYNSVLSIVSEIEEIVGKNSFPDVQNWKVKALIGLDRFQDAKKELNILYTLNPGDKVIDDIATYEDSIETGIKAEQQRKESLRLAELERKRKAEQAELERKRKARLEQLEYERKLQLKKEKLQAIQKEKEYIKNTAYNIRAIKDTTYFDKNWVEVLKNSHNIKYFRPPVKFQDRLYYVENYIPRDDSKKRANLYSSFTASNIFNDGYYPVGERIYYSERSTKNSRGKRIIEMFNTKSNKTFKIKNQDIGLNFEFYNKDKMIIWSLNYKEGGQIDQTKFYDNGIIKYMKITNLYRGVYYNYNESIKNQFIELFFNEDGYLIKRHKCNKKWKVKKVINY